MNHNHGFLLLLALLLASSALAQTDNSQTTNGLSKNDLAQQVAVARCAYTEAEQACASNAKKAPDAGSNTTLAQLPRRMGPMGPPMGRAAYPGMWMSRPSPAHLLIGGLVGFGVGVAVGARNNGGVRGSLGIGALFGLIGAGIGAGVPSFPSPRYYRRGWPDGNDDEEASQSNPGPPKQRRTRQTATAQPDPPPSTAKVENPRGFAAETP